MQLGGDSEVVSYTIVEISGTLFGCGQDQVSIH